MLFTLRVMLQELRDIYIFESNLKEYESLHPYFIMTIINISNI